MPQQIYFFEKNKADITNTDVVITASQADEFTAFMQNRDNNSAWITTGSQDSDNTNFVIDFGSERDITDIILIKNNFKDYTIQYWNGAAYVDFSTAINVTSNSTETVRHTFDSVNTLMVKVIITATFVVDDEKRLFQFIVTDLIGQLDGWPVIKPVDSKNRIRNKMLSGKKRIIENSGGFRCSLSVKNWGSDADLTIIESLYDSIEGFLLWLSGGDETQFRSNRIGYRKEDLFLMKASNEYSPAYVTGIYTAGLKIKIDLEEIA